MGKRQFMAGLNKSSSKTLWTSEESEVSDEDWGKRMRREGRNCRGMKEGKVRKDSKRNHSSQSSKVEEDEKCHIIKFHFCSN